MAGFQRWLEDKWMGHPCPICGEAGTWKTAGHAQLHTYGRGAFGGGGRHYPLGVVTCSNCGYVVLIDIGAHLPEWVATAEEEAKPEAEAGTS